MIVTCSCWSPQSIRFINSSSHDVFPWFVYLGKQAGFIWQLPVKIKKHLDYDLPNWFYFKNVFVFQTKTLIYFFFKNVLPLHLFDHIVVESYGMSKCILPLSQKSKSGLEDNFPTFECQPLKRLSLDRASSVDREAIHPMCWQTVSIFCPILQPKPTNIYKKTQVTHSSFTNNVQVPSGAIRNSWTLGVTSTFLHLYNVTPERNISSREERKLSLTK